MAGNTFGQLFRVTTAGESHGPANVVILDGVPPGLELAEADLLPDLQRRRPGQSKLTTQRHEEDHPEILSGVFEGRTTGTALAILLRNSDQRSADYANMRDTYRPGHADFTFDAKYGLRDYRGGGRSSARETIARVAAGAVAKKILRQHGISIVGYVKQVGDVVAAIADPTAITLEMVESNIARCPDAAAAARMIDLIDTVRKEADSIGGISELVATGVPAGLGEPVFDKLKADLAKALLSLPAVTAFEYGDGFAVARRRGSENNDPFTKAISAPKAAASSSPSSAATAAGIPSATIRTTTNHHGGMLGGISSGMPLICRVALKPTSSIPRPQATVTRQGEPTELVTKGRHDPCLLPRFVPVGEAMIALVLVDHLLRFQAQCPRGGEGRELP